MLLMPIPLPPAPDITAAPKLAVIIPTSLGTDLWWDSAWLRGLAFGPQHEAPTCTSLLSEGLCLSFLELLERHTQTGAHTLGMNSLAILGPDAQNQGVDRAGSSRGCEGQPVLDLSWFLRVCWHPWCSPSLPSSLHGLLHVCLSLSKCPLFIRMPVVLDDGPLLQYDLSLINYSYNGCLQIRSCSEVSGVRTSAYSF